MDLVDIGANLTNRSFASDLDEVLTRAKDAGVTRIVVTGTSADASQTASELVSTREGLWSTAGVHPHHAKTYGDGVEAQLREIAAAPRTVAIGECGLDYNRNYSPPSDQRRAFAAQLALAIELDLPVFLHERDAHQDFASIVAEHRDGLRAGVIHCFTGSGDEMRRCLELDLHIGITGWICDERRGTHLRTLVGEIPSDRMMLETDAPYLLPRDLQLRPKSRRNEPAFLRHILGVVASCRGENEDDVARKTTATAAAFFGL